MTVRRRIIVAVNPAASFGRNSGVGPHVVDRLSTAGHTVTQLSEPSVGQLRARAADAIAAGTDLLVVVGGDGMVSLGANLVAQTTVPLGIIPTGTGNDAARALGIPTGDPDAALAVLTDALERPPRIIDLGRVTSIASGDQGLGTWFVCALSAGFDAVVTERANRMRRPRGRSRYVLAMLRELLTLRPIEYALTIDSTPLTERGMLLAVSNGISIGGGMKITPGARLDDGKLDLLLVSPLSRLRFLRLFPKVFSGTHVDLDVVRIERVNVVTVDAPGVTAYADGERVAAALPVRVDIVPGALHVLAPRPH